jgi:hypothetical protein
MRIGEILVVGPTGVEMEKFLRNLSSLVEEFGKDVQFGLLPIEEQIVLHFYGIQWTRYAKNYPWELLTQKALGAFILLDWDFPETVAAAEEILEFFQAEFDLPVVVASVLKGNTPSLRAQVYRGGLPLTKNSRMTFYSLNQPDSMRQLIVDLININLEHLAA